MVLDFGLLSSKLFPNSNARGEGISARSKDVLDGEIIGMVLVATIKRVVAGTSFTFTGLSGDFDYVAKVNLQTAAGAVASVTINYNEDVTATNYWSVLLTTEYDGTVTGSGANDNVIGSIPAGSFFTGEINISITQGGTNHIRGEGIMHRSQGNQGNGHQIIQFANDRNVPANELNKIQFVCSSNVKAGSQISLYRLSR